MIIDTSALLAIVFDEPDGPALLRVLVEAPTRLMSSANALEAWIVADRHENPDKAPALDALIETLGIDIEPVTVQQARVARGAYHPLWQGTSSSWVELWRLFCVCLSQDHASVSSVQGQRFFPD